MQGRKRKEGPLSVVDVSEQFPAFRVVKSDDINKADFLDSLRSHYELDREPRGIEQRRAVIHMGISMFKSRESAAAMSRKWPKLGRFVAKVELRACQGFNLAETGPVGHLTIWGRPPQLAQAIAEIYPVD